MKTERDPETSTGHLAGGKNAPKSRNGCLTCNLRRKKCDKMRLVWKDCKLFGKECV